MRRFVAVTTEVALLLCGLTLVAISANYPVIRHMTTRAYPRELAIDVDAAGARALFQGSGLAQCGRGFSADQTYPNIDIVLPDNQARTIRPRQLGTTDVLFWSIHELELWERVRQHR